MILCAAGNTQKLTAAMAHHHMRRSAVSAGRPGGLIRGIAWKGNMRVGQILSKTGCGGGRFEKKY